MRVSALKRSVVLFKQLCAQADQNLTPFSFTPISSLVAQSACRHSRLHSAELVGFASAAEPQADPEKDLGTSGLSRWDQQIPQQQHATRTPDSSEEQSITGQTASGQAAGIVSAAAEGIRTPEQQGAQVAAHSKGAAGADHAQEKPLSTKGWERKRKKTFGSITLPESPNELGRVLQPFFRKGTQGAETIIAIFESFLAKVAYREKEKGIPRLPKYYPAIPSWYMYMTAIAELKHDGKIGKLERCLRLLESLDMAPGQASANLYSLLLGQLTKQGTAAASRKAVGIVRELERAGEVNWYHYTHAILCCIGGHNEFSAANKLMLKLEALPPNPYVEEDMLLKSRLYQGIIIMHAQNRRVHLCHDYLMKALREGIHPSGQTLQVCASYGIEMDDSPFLLVILRLFASMQDQAPWGQKGSTVDEGTLLGVIAQAARTGAVELAELAWRLMVSSIMTPLPPVVPEAQPVKEGDVEVMEETRRNLAVPIPSAFHGLIHCYAKAGDFRSAFRTLGQLQEAHPRNGELVAFMPMLSMLVDALASSVDMVDSAYYILEEMHAQGEAVTPPMLNCIIAACSQIGDISRAFETFESFGALGMTPDTNSYNAVICGCVAHDLLDSIPKKEVVTFLANRDEIALREMTEKRGLTPRDGSQEEEPRRVRQRFF